MSSKEDWDTVTSEKTKEVKPTLPAGQPAKYKEFYTQEIESLSELSGTIEDQISQIRQRVIKYGEQIHSFHAKQSAALNWIDQHKDRLSKEARARLRIEDLKYKPQEPKEPKSTRPAKKVSPEVARRAMVKVLRGQGIPQELAASMAEKAIK